MDLPFGIQSRLRDYSTKPSLFYDSADASMPIFRRVRRDWDTGACPLTGPMRKRARDERQGAIDWAGANVRGTDAEFFCPLFCL